MWTYYIPIEAQFIWEQGEAINIFIQPNCPDAIVRKPDTGRRKPAKNGLFLEVFGIFHPLPDTIFNPNFKRR